MSRYVDISKLEMPEDDCCYADLEAFVETICESEYIDIVRCRECKHSGVRNDADVECKRHKLIMRLNDFCSYGERDKDTNVLNKTADGKE